MKIVHSIVPWVVQIGLLIWLNHGVKLCCATDWFGHAKKEYRKTFLVGSSIEDHGHSLDHCDCNVETDDQSRSNNAFLVELDMETGAATLSLNSKEPWFHLVGNMTRVVGWNNDEPLVLDFSSVVDDQVAGQYNRFGSYTNVTFVWKATSFSDDQTLQTSFLVFSQRQMIIFEQFFPVGWTNPNSGSKSKIISGFPIINMTLPKDDLGYISWGDCMLSHPSWGDWNTVDPGQYAQLFDADSYGQPWILHDRLGRTVVWSNLDDFFVSGFAAKETEPLLDVGLRTTLNSVPKGHKHASILVSGQGINATIMEWGDILLTNGNVQKDRTKVYDDFTLAMLGYWTDNGAYHYTGATGPHYSNMEEALLGVKKGMEEKKIPVRYVQWDDWWMDSAGDIPGMLSWTPKKEVFPSGFSDWLGMPLAMYAPEYSSRNVWMSDYTWKVDDKTAIPIDSKFYYDLFRNGTLIGMKMFEQDFLCHYGIGRTTLTNTDVTSGLEWLSYMNHAAQESGIKLQLCMPDAYHILQSTLLPSVTNGRGTQDNTRDYPSILSMGPNTLLFYALGIFTSRDNVWTSRADVNQTGCGNAKFCNEPNAHLDNAVAVLSGGPYGIADAVDHVNRTVVMYSCRSDGLLLRPRLPLSSVDFSFIDDDAKGSLVWASHDDYGSLRWSYVIAVDSTKEIGLTPKRLSNANSCSCGTMVAWEVRIGRPVAKVTPFSNHSPFMLPRSKPLNLPYKVDSPPHTHYNVAPVLLNGMVFLGETNKWATMSFGRVLAFDVDATALSVVVAGAPSEIATFAYMKNSRKTDDVNEIQCSFASSCPFVDEHGNPYCENRIICSSMNGCICAGMSQKTSQRLGSSIA